MAATGTWFYWLDADSLGSDWWGRSNSRDYALRSAERYSFDTARFKACNTKVVMNLGEPDEETIAFFQAQPGVPYRKR